MRVKCFRFEVLQRPSEFFHGKPLSSFHCNDATVAGFLTHSFMHLQLFRDAFDVTSWGCARTSLYVDIYIYIHTHKHNVFSYTRIHIHSRLAGGNPTTTFSAFPRSPSLLFVYTVPLGWLNNGATSSASNLTPSIFLHFSPSATATIVPLITLPRTYCRFYFLLLPLLRGRVPRKKEEAVDVEMN